MRFRCKGRVGGETCQHAPKREIFGALPKVVWVCGVRYLGR